MSKQEGSLKSALAREMKLRLPSFYILLHATAGAPDRSITGGGRTTLWEMKNGTPEFDSMGNQELMCERLAVSGFCRYVIWQEHRGVQRTMIVHPREIRRRNGWHVVPEAFTVGFDHRWLVEQIRKIHGV